MVVRGKSGTRWTNETSKIFVSYWRRTASPTYVHVAPINVFDSHSSIFHVHDNFLSRSKEASLGRLRKLSCNLGLLEGFFHVQLGIARVGSLQGAGSVHHPRPDPTKPRRKILTSPSSNAFHSRWTVPSSRWLASARNRNSPSSSCTSPPRSADTIVGTLHARVRLGGSGTRSKSISAKPKNTCCAIAPW